MSTVSHVCIKAVVPAEHCGYVLQVHRTTEHFEVVVCIVEHLDVFDGSTTTHATEGQAVDFVIRREDIATVAELDKIYSAAVVTVVASSVNSTAEGISNGVGQAIGPTVDRLLSFNEVSTNTTLEGDSRRVRNRVTRNAHNCSGIICHTSHPNI